MQGLGKGIGTGVLKRDSSKVGEMVSNGDRAPRLLQRCHGACCRLPATLEALEYYRRDRKRGVEGDKR